MAREARVLRAWRPTRTTLAIRVSRPPDLAFTPWSSMMLMLATPEGVERRPLSVASGPDRPHLEFAVRDGPSAFKRAFAALREGDAVMLAGPRAHFALDVARDAVLLAGGIGITPHKAHLEHAASVAPGARIRLLYSSRSADDVVFADELRALQERMPRLAVEHTVTRGAPGDGWTGRRGRFGDDDLAAALAALPEADVYVAGPPGFVEGTLAALARLGVAPARVRAERFWGYRPSNEWSDAGGSRRT